MMGMMFLILEVVTLVSLASAFMVLLVKKWGIAEWFQIHGNNFTSLLFSCDLCMSFWAAVILVPFVAFFVCCYWWVLLVPVFSTPLTRMMV